MSKYSFKKINLIYIQSSSIGWSDDVEKLYLKKISPYVGFQTLPIKSKSLGRSESSVKCELESQSILKKIDDKSLVWVFDEAGESLTSEKLAQDLESSFLEGPQKELNLIIGGAFGLSDKLKAQAQKKISLSKLVFNHHIAKSVVLEQLYRSFKIIHSESYHNI